MLTLQEPYQKGIINQIKQKNWILKIKEQLVLNSSGEEFRNNEWVWVCVHVCLQSPILNILSNLIHTYNLWALWEKVMCLFYFMLISQQSVWLLYQATPHWVWYQVIVSLCAWNSNDVFGLKGSLNQPDLDYQLYSMVSVFVKVRSSAGLTQCYIKHKLMTKDFHHLHKLRLK